MRAASLLEAIARWHIFVEANKRTALMVTDHYLSVNNYTFVKPLDTVRFIVNIANNKKKG